MPTTPSKKCPCMGNDILYFNFELIDNILDEKVDSNLINEIIKTARGGKANFLGLYDEFGAKINNRSLEKFNCKAVIDSESGKIRLINKKHFKK